MTQDEYNERIKRLEAKLEDEKNTLLKEFVDSNNPYKKGDIVTDHIGSIRIEKIKYATGGMLGIPCAVYFGIELTKKGVPKKIATKRDVYQRNILKAEK